MSNIEERLKHYLVDDPWLDSEHTEIVIRLDTLANNFDAFSVDGVVERYINIRKLWVKHTQQEEAEMLLLGYSDVQRQAALHAKIIKSFSTNPTRHHVLDLITKILDHVDNCDRNYAAFKKQKLELQ